MASPLRLDIDPPAHGWTVIRLTAPGVDLTFDASAIPRDSIGDLAAAVRLIAAGGGSPHVVWNSEPVEHEFRFRVIGDRVRLDVFRFPDMRRPGPSGADPIASIEGDRMDVARALWRGLRRLHGGVRAGAYEQAWGHRYPDVAEDSRDLAPRR